MSGDIIAAHCRGNSCLKLCFRPFAMSRSSESSCLANLYFNLPTTALKLCTQEVLVLPETLSAIYFEDSTYLVTSRDADCKLFNYSRAAKKSGELIRGCRSCLLRPSCNGRIETPDGGCIETPDGALVRIADPRTCQYETGLTITIQQHPLIRALFATLNEAKRNLPDVMIPEVLREQARSEMVEGLRLNLIQLPEGSVDQEGPSGYRQILCRPDVEETYAFPLASGPQWTGSVCGWGYDSFNGPNLHRPTMCCEAGGKCEK